MSTEDSEWDAREKQLATINKTNYRCKYWDCGWCYAGDDKDTNATMNGCVNPIECKELQRQKDNLK